MTRKLQKWFQAPICLHVFCYPIHTFIHFEGHCVTAQWGCGIWSGCVCGVREADWCSTCPSCGAAGRHHCTCCGSARLSRQRRGRAHWSGGVWGEATAGVVRRINLQTRARERKRSVCEVAHSTFQTCNLSFPSAALRLRLTSLSLCSAKMGSSILLILQAEQQ